MEDLSKNAEIQEALKKFEMEYTKETEPSVPAPQNESVGMVAWVIKHSGGTVKSEKQAEYILVGFAVLAIIVSLFLFFSDGQGTTTEIPTGRKIIYPENMPPMLEQI